MAQSEKVAGSRKSWMLTQMGIESIDKTLARSVES
jgi:hypothetical protein